MVDALTEKLAGPAIRLIDKGKVEDNVRRYRLKSLAGYLDFELDEKAKTAWILNLEIKPQFREQGQATRLLDELFRIVAGGLVVPGNFTADRAEARGLLRRMKRLGRQYRVRIGDYSFDPGK